jgi:hypothetical protein
MVNDNQQRMCDCKIRPVLAPIPCDAPELLRQVRPLAAKRGPCGLDECAFEPDAAGRRPSALSLGGALVLAAGQARPRRQMTGRRKAVYIEPDLGDDDLRYVEVDAGGRDQPGQRLSKRVKSLLDALAVKDSAAPGDQDD